MPIDSTSPEDTTPPEDSSEAAADTPPVEPFPAIETGDAEQPSESVEPESAALELTTDTLPASDAELSAPKETLVELAARAEKGRLSLADETGAAQAMKQCLLDGRAGVALVVELLPKFAWMVAVNGVTAAWPDLTSGFRTQLLSGLGKDESDAAQRLRLSIARGLFKQDVPAALKLAVGAAKDLRDKETGALAAKEAQVFANVFIGRARPWLAGLPLAELKPADADALVHCAALAAFSLPHPPVTQLGVLKWAAEAGRLAKLQPPALEAIKAGVARWNAKWQAALRKEVAELPDEIAAALREPSERTPVENAGLESPGSEEAEPTEEPINTDIEESATPELPRVPRQYPVYVSKTIPPREVPTPETETRSEAPPPIPSRRGGTSAANLNVTETLRLVEAHVAWLRGELKSAQNKLKDREGERRGRRTERDKPIIEGEPTLEELARLNQQLEARIAELQQRIDDLAVDSEQRAASFGVISGQPVTDPEAALRTLLALKLQEDYEDFLALDREANDIVVQAHYRTLLRHIFDVLLQEGVGLKKSEST
ncbi:MAG TPA: hypothetical protein VFD27_03140 [Chthoniobacteraceae bacterium]|nr:hypothetical protein [Chthoniobacteraceae bacterium]